MDPHPKEVIDILRRKGPETRIAVVGASSNPQKYGNIIVRNLVGKGYTVLPVNPRESAIEGLTVYATLADVPRPIDIVDVVTPPAVTKQVLADAAAAGVPNVWLQDGSWDDAVLEIAERSPFRTVYQACIMVASNH